MKCEGLEPEVIVCVHKLPSNSYRNIHDESKGSITTTVKESPDEVVSAGDKLWSEHTGCRSVALSTENMAALTSISMVHNF